MGTTAEVTTTEDLTPVESSNIDAIGFDVTDIINDVGRLTVRFKNKSTYDYDNVPALIGTEIFEAESVGRYFSTFVRGKFEGQKRIEDEEE